MEIAESAATDRHRTNVAEANSGARFLKLNLNNNRLFDPGLGEANPQCAFTLSEQPATIGNIPENDKVKAQCGFWLFVFGSA